MTLIHEAAERGNVQRIRELLTRRDINDSGRRGGSPLFSAIVANHSHVVRALVEMGADVNLRAEGDVGERPIHLAVTIGNHKMIRALLESGADINAKTNAGDTPLHLAVQYNGQLRTIRLLMSQGASIAARNKAGQTPIDLSREQGSEEITSVLCVRAEVLSAAKRWHLGRGAIPPTRK